MTEEMLNHIALEYHQTTFLKAHGSIKAKDVYHNICMVCGNVQDSIINAGDELDKLITVSNITPVGKRSMKCDDCKQIQYHLPMMHQWVLNILSVHGLLIHNDPEFMNKPNELKITKTN